MYVFMGCMLQFYPYKTHNLSYILYIGPLTSTFEQIATLRTKRTPKDQSSEYLEKANEKKRGAHSALVNGPVPRQQYRPETIRSILTRDHFATVARQHK